ncbi:MAG: hypothetical protein JSS04_05485 [Proteobacteria bacterium]|nr:hypothetical protein [Pseudomonadota bacterium]
MEGLGQLYDAPDLLAPPAYIRVIDFYAALLKTALTAPPAEKRAIVDSVAADLSLKLDFATAAPQLAGQPPMQVDVRVFTRRFNQQIDGYQISWNPQLYSGQEPMFTFLNLTSPATGTLPPGRYTMLVVKDHVVVSRETEQIGLGGERSIDVVAPLP